MFVANALNLQSNVVCHNDYVKTLDDIENVLATPLTKLDQAMKRANLDLRALGLRNKRASNVKEFDQDVAKYQKENFVVGFIQTGMLIVLFIRFFLTATSKLIKSFHQSLDCVTCFTFK